MCGFIAVFSRGAPVSPERLHLAAGSLRHRGPDAQGEGVQEIILADGSRISMGLAHTRLSILDLDARSNQPFLRRDKALVYNGEIYNFRSLRPELASSGIAFHTEGDTEVLLEALAASGPAALQRMSGQWAFAFADLAKGTVLASRDRFGKKPLFWFQDAELLILSSTVRGISTYLQQRPRFAERFAREFLAFGAYYTQPEESPFEQIQQVGPGTVRTFDLRTWASGSERYFDVAAEAAAFDGESDLADRLGNAVRQRLVSDRPVGLLLSGGVDSTLILSVLKAKGLHEQVTCFIGDTGLSEDAAYGRQAAAACGLRPEVVKIDYGRTALDHFLRVCRHQERPFPLMGNLVAMPQMFEQIATTQIRVVLDGTGADEIFGGYWDRQFPFALRDAVRRGDWRWLGRVMARTPRAEVRRLLSATRSALRMGRHPGIDPLTDPKLSFDAALVTDITAGRLTDWLWQNDRNSMMYGIEARSPFLDMSLAKFAGSGYRNKFDGRHNKLELRKVFSSFVELPTQWRIQKQGFRWDAGKFVRQNAASLAELISSSRYLDLPLRNAAVADLANSSPVAQQTRSCISLAAVEHEMNKL